MRLINPLRILIVEDDQVVAMDMEDMIRALGYEVTESADSYTSAVAILTRDKPDVALLDIKLDGIKDGIELAAYIRAHAPMPIIFVTSHVDKKTVARATETHPNGYLLKPFGAANLFAAIETAVVNYQATLTSSASTETLEQDHCIMVKSNRMYVKIPVADVKWIESDLNYIHIHSPSGKHTVRMSFKDLLANFPKDHFVQTHKSFMVVPRYISAISNDFVMVAQDKIPLSRSFRERVNALSPRIR